MDHPELIVWKSPLLMNVQWVNELYIEISCPQE